ncbi:glycosyl hydrolase family 28 protein [Streptomyces sp. NPDC019937]|uniref:glycoside hydrolase family 28 protein n=1 Tax=Streptomyces sp. NPDC019937 TaxID=3154787 RepID=UPI0033D66700
MTRSTRLRLAATTAAGACLLAAAPLTATAQPGPAHRTYDVRDYGATGDGTTLDDDAIDRAIEAAAAGPGRGTVLFPPGTYKSRTVHLKSDITLHLAKGATLLAAAGGMDAAEPNPWDAYQDFGHSHFRNALLTGENIHHLAITGSGTLDGEGLGTSNTLDPGVGDKILSLKRCAGLDIKDVTFTRGGHFALLLNGCDGVRMTRTKVLTSTDRDAVNLINSRHVDIGHSRIEGRDDGVVLKSDYALGRTYTSHDIRVHDSDVLSTENNALQFGSETCGDFRDIRFDRLRIGGGGKAAIGIVSMDGADISDVRYSDVTMTKGATPVFIKIGDRKRCPGAPPAGRIHDIAFTDVTGTGLTHPVTGVDYTSTITGAPGADVEDITFDRVRLTVPGGHPASDAELVPGEYLTDYVPKTYGVRPSYGWWIRHAKNITFTDSAVRTDSGDDRPAFIADDGAAITLDRVTAQRGTASPYDVGFSGVTGFVVRHSTTTDGERLRIRTTG